MSLTKHIFSFIIQILIFNSASNAESLNPHKDDLFTLNGREVIETRNNGGFKRYYWDEMQDVNGRDEVPGVSAKSERIDWSVNEKKRSQVISYPGGNIDTYSVGETKDAKLAVIFVHGADGSKELGVNDTSFGGNFNRLKNIAVKNNGVYYSPTVSFDSQGTQGVLEIIKNIKSKSPDAKIVIACGSAGAYTCWQLADKKEAVDNLSGIVMLGGARMHPDYTNSVAFKRKIPIFISHGSKDKLVPWQMWDKEYEKIYRADNKYPIKFELFNNGKHGTPMRMIDWKETLSWMYSNTPTRLSPTEQIEAESTRTSQ